MAGCSAWFRYAVCHHGASFRHGSAGENMAVFVSHAFVLYYSGALFRYEKYDSILACVKDQAKKLLFPYAMLTIVCAPFWYINHIVLGDGKVSFKRLLVGFLTADQYEGTMTNGALWFLPALFLTSVVFWFLVDLEHKGKVNLAGSLGICAALAIGVGISARENLLRGMLLVFPPWLFSTVSVVWRCNHIVGIVTLSSRCLQR